MSEAEPIRRSFLGFVCNALGVQYTILLPLAGLICFLLALILVLRGRGPMAAAGLILIVHVPFLLGVFAALQGGIASYTVIATSTTTPKASDVAAGISTALVAPLVGMLLMAPGYAIAALGASIRSFGADAAQQSQNH